MSVLACLATQPAVCESFVVDEVHADDGRAISFGECLGSGGQAAARKWADEHAGYVVRKIRCSVASGNDAGKLRDQLASPRA